jgi:hypothetical protein
VLLDEKCKKIVMGWEFYRDWALEGDVFMNNTSGLGILNRVQDLLLMKGIDYYL